jgi:hypothetical protein
MVDTKLRGKDEEGLTKAMDRISIAAGGRPSKGLREHSRAAWKLVRPHWNRTAWWTMLFISVVVVGLDVNEQLGGAIGSAINWVRMNILKRFPSLAYIIGVLACYYIFFKGHKDKFEEPKG